jgi:hypothetical protein
MKMYNNGQRKGMMYGGGATPRKPMMYGGMTKKKKMNMGGLADQNRKSSAGQAGMMNPMGSMTEKKKFSMGMRKGGKLSAGLAALKKERPDVVKKMGFRKGGKTEETKVAASSLGMNKYGLAAKKVGDKYESYKDGKLTGTFNSIKKLQDHQIKLITPKT